MLIRAVCTWLCSSEDKPGEIGIIVALAMLILGTFQWAVITSITVDGLVCTNTHTPPQIDTKYLHSDISVSIGIIQYP